MGFDGCRLHTTDYLLEISTFNVVVPAQAGTRCRFTKATGFPPARE